MRYIPMSVLEYRFDDEGEAVSVVVQLSVYDAVARDTFNATVELSEEFIQSINSSVTLNRLTKVQADNYARRLLINWVNVKPPVDVDPDPEGSTEEYTEE